MTFTRTGVSNPAPGGLTSRLEISYILLLNLIFKISVSSVYLSVVTIQPVHLNQRWSVVFGPRPILSDPSM